MCSSKHEAEIRAIKTETFTGLVITFMQKGWLNRDIVTPLLRESHLAELDDIFAAGDAGSQVPSNIDILKVTGPNNGDTLVDLLRSKQKGIEISQNAPLWLLLDKTKAQSFVLASYASSVASELI